MEILGVREKETEVERDVCPLKSDRQTNKETRKQTGMER